LLNPLRELYSGAGQDLAKRWSVGRFSASQTLGINQTG